MISEDLKACFDALHRELLSIKSDLVVLRYDMEQLDKKLDQQRRAHAEPQDWTQDMTGRKVEIF
jgi:hypothetical protein